MKISGTLHFVPPEDIDEYMLQNLPPVGQNLPPQDLQNQNKNGPQYFGQQQPQQTYHQQQNGYNNQGFNQQNQPWNQQNFQNTWDNNNQQGGWNNQWPSQ